MLILLDHVLTVLEVREFEAPRMPDVSGHVWYGGSAERTHRRSSFLLVQIQAHEDPRVCAMDDVRGPEVGKPAALVEA